LSLHLFRACKPLLLAGFVWQFCLAAPAFSKDRWTELNIGSFYVDTDADLAAARDDLSQLEQLRWVLGGLLESKDLRSVWPIRVLLTRNAKTNPTGNQGKFVWQNGQCLLVVSPDAKIPLGEVAGILLDANTPRLPPAVESGMRSLFSTLEAHGSRVSWGGAPAHPDPAWALMRLFGTKFEYGASFHIFLTSLKGGSDMRIAARNAFGKDFSSLEQEAQASLQAGNWQPVAVSGRPLDPKRDFGEHSLDPAVAEVYLADSQLTADPHAAEAAYKAAIAAGGATAALGYEGLASIAKLDKRDAQGLLENAIRVGSKSAPVYMAAAENSLGDEALPLIKSAMRLNPLWGEPVYRQAQLAIDPAEKLSLLRKATQLDPRMTKYWVELAQVETTRGEATAADGAWLRAEDSAPEGAERDRIHQLRVDSEQQRLDAAEAAQRQEREAVHLADQQAQDAETARIRAAEQKANAAVDAAAGGEKPTDVKTWESLVPKKNLTGVLVRVDCLRHGQRLWVKDKSGATMELYLREARSELACGAQTSPRRVSIAYHALPDDDLHTAGEITELEIQ